MISPTLTQLKQIDITYLGPPSSDIFAEAWFSSGFMLVCEQIHGVDVKQERCPNHVPRYQLIAPTQEDDNMLIMGFPLLLLLLMLLLCQ
jgi:hypothetical protein